jgi:hypothetical protein
MTDLQRIMQTWEQQLDDPEMVRLVISRIFRGENMKHREPLMRGTLIADLIDAVDALRDDDPDAPTTQNDTTMEEHQ